MAAAAEVAPRAGKGRGKERRRWVLGFWFMVYMPAGGGFGTWAEEVKMSACPEASTCKVFPFFGNIIYFVLTK